MRFDLALQQLDIEFDNEGQGGAAEFVDPSNGGEWNFLWYANFNRLKITLMTAEPICTCGKDFAHPDCECEWEGFGELGTSVEKTFTKAQYLKEKQQSKLF